MNKSFKNIGALLSLGSILVTATALAAGPWSNSVTIADIEVDSVTGGSETYLQFGSSPTGKPACGTAGQVQLVGSADAVRAMTALATAAYLSGKQVRVYWDGGCNGVYAGVNKLRSF